MSVLTQPAATDESLRYSGDFSLRLSARSAGRAIFVEPGAIDDDGVRLAFVIDGTWQPVAVRVQQPDEFGPVYAEVLANPDGADRTDIRANLRRILSLAPEGRGLGEVAGRDPVAGGLIKRFRGLRTIAYPTPFEAAARTVIGHRLPLARAAAIFADIAKSRGSALAVGDGHLHAFPAPDVLAGIRTVGGLSERKVDQLRTLGREVADGGLRADDLRSLDQGEAMERLQQLPGIGPFSAELILIRGAGDPDVFARTEGRLHQAMSESYGLGGNLDVDHLEELAEAWCPYRSWVSVMFRDATKDSSTGSAAA